MREEIARMRKAGLVVLFFVVAAFGSRADETNLTLTVDGVTYSNVTFGTVSPSAVSIYHSTGITRIPLAKLPPELQRRFGYDPQKAADWQKREQQAVATQEAAKQRAKWLKVHACNIMGTVVSVVEGKGLILSNQICVNQCIRYGVTDPRLLQLKVAFLETDTKGLVDGTLVRCSACLEGTHTYTTTAGALKKINRYVFVGPEDESKRGVACVD